MSDQETQHDAEIASTLQKTLVEGSETQPNEQEQEPTAADADNSNKPKRRAKEPTSLEREPGKSVFPVSRVQRVLKADKELPMVSREAVLLISLATEEFVKRISEASHRLAHRENRMTVQRKDIASVCRRAEEFMFLEELIPLYEPENTARRKPKSQQQKDADNDNPPPPKTMLDQFVSRPKADSEGPPDGGAEDEDIMMNEDGTMTM